MYLQNLGEDSSGYLAASMIKSYSKAQLLLNNAHSLIHTDPLRIFIVDAFNHLYFCYICVL